MYFGKIWLYILLHDFNLTYYSSIILDSFSILLFPKLCWHIGLTPSISMHSLSSSSSVQHMINNSSTYVYVYKHFEFIFVAFATLVNTYSLPQIYPNLTILWKCAFYANFVATFAYYAGIMLNAFALPLCSKLCWHNRLKPNVYASTKLTQPLM